MGIRASGEHVRASLLLHDSRETGLTPLGGPLGLRLVNIPDGQNPGQINHAPVMHSLPKLFEQNQAWAEAIKLRDPQFFQKLSRQQNPEYLWIGCSDSRVPANEIVGLLPGEVFVHRNIANVVVHTDLNCLSVIQFAVDVLKVKHIMVVGHYGCGGVGKVIRCERVGLADNWLRHVKDVRDKHDNCLGALPDDTARSARLCELNVVEQVANVSSTTIIQDAWTRGQELTLHGWIYGLRDGLLRDLKVSASSLEEANASYKAAVAAVYERRFTTAPW